MNLPVISLGDLLHDAELFTDGDWVESKDQDEAGNLRLIQLADIGDGYFVNKSARFMNQEAFTRLRCTELKEGDLLIARMPDPLGRCCIFPSDQKKCATVVDVCIVRPNKDRIDTNWLKHAINSQSVRTQIKNYSRGATRVRISRKDLAKLLVPNIELAEQKRIAAILDKAAEIKAKREQAIAKLEELVQSTFLEMFGNPVNNEKGWKSVSLGSVTSKLGSGATPSGGDASYKAEGIPLIRSLNVHDGEFVYKNLAHIDDEQAEKLSNVVVEKDDVLLNITGASVARVCRVPDDVVPARVNQHVMIVRATNKINPIFLERQLLSAYMKQKLLKIGGAGATREAITKAQAVELNVICPPITEQEKYVAVASLVEKLKAKEIAGLASLEKTAASLQHQAFTTGFAA